jgi:hypothetical protein
VSATVSLIPRVPFLSLAHTCTDFSAASAATAASRACSAAARARPSSNAFCSAARLRSVSRSYISFVRSSSACMR